MSTNGQQHVRFKDMFVKSPEAKMLERIEQDERARGLADQMEVAKRDSKTSPELRKLLKEKHKELEKVEKDVITKEKERH